MLQSTIEKILPQLPALCDRLGVDKFHRDAYFAQNTTGLMGEVLVSVGEINWEGSYLLTFNVSGKLLSIHRETWSMSSDYGGTSIHTETIPLEG